MIDQSATDTQPEDRESLIELGKSLGLAQASNMKTETLRAKIAEKQNLSKKLDELVIEIDECTRSALLERGFDFNHLKMRAKEYRIDKLIYDPKMKAFGCFRGGDLIDFLDAGAF